MSIETRWWKRENDLQLHQEVVYNRSDGIKGNWERIFHIIQLSDTTSISSLFFIGDTRTAEKTQIHPLLSHFPNLERIKFTMTSDQDVFCNPVVNDLLLLHESDATAEKLVLPRLRTLVFHKSKVNCISRAGQERNWNARLAKLDKEDRKIPRWFRLGPGSHVDSCVLSNLKKSLELRRSKGAPGVMVCFHSCLHIIEENVKDFLQKPYISSLEFKNCTWVVFFTI